MLIGTKIRLTEVRLEDKASLFRWINDPSLVHLHGPYHPVSAMTHEAWFATIGKDARHFHFAIRPIVADEIVGLVQLLNLHSVFRSVELRIRIGPEDQRGHGAGSEAVSLASLFAFRDLNIERLFLYVFADNPGA